MSLPEILLWRERRKRPDGLKFRKQHPAGPYVLDFFCSEANLCVEIDGQYHDRGDRPDADERRDAWLRLHDIATLRIAAKAVLQDIEPVVIDILETARSRLGRNKEPA